MMTVRDAAIRVLKEAGTALHAHEIAKRMLAGKLWATKGKTPHQTVAACLYLDIKRNAEASPFVLHGPQTFTLRSPHKVSKRHDEPNRGVIQESDKPRRKAFSFTDSAEKVLESFGDKRPMHYRDITERALAQGWLATQGRTPEASMYAQILTEIRRYQRRGERPRFVQHGRGYVGLSRWMGQGLAFEIEQHNKKVRQDLLKSLLEMRWDEFEELIARLLAGVGFEDIEMTGRSNDGGIDVRATLVVGEVVRTRMAVQVKKWKRNVQAPIVQQVRGSLGTHEQGLIITTKDYSPGARKEAARPDAVPVALMNGEQLAALLVESEIGIIRRSHEILEISKEDETSAD